MIGPEDHSDRPPAQGSPAQGSPAQGSPAQGSPAQGLAAEGAPPGRRPFTPGRIPSVAPWVAAGLGCSGALAAAVTRPDYARLAAAQDWPPFVLVSGLLLIGLVANQDGLFAAAGHLLARSARNGIVLYAGAVLLIATVTTLLNLDTSVAFLTPILVYTARSRGEGEAPLLYGCILLANAGSLLLPGSNLTNLIVLGEVHLSGGQFFRHMAPPGIAAILVTAVVVGVVHHRSLRATATVGENAGQPVFGVGLVAIAAATVLVLVLRSPALPVAAVGVAAVAIKARNWPGQARRALEVLGLPILIGLFGIAVALGTLGRAWSGPAELLHHLDTWATAAVAALLAVLVNNLPAASLLASRPPPRPFALLIGLNIGPNLFITGSLAWALWWRAARTAGARPTVSAAARVGLVAAPLAIAAALAILTV
ncbi:MAG TPA: SLC13 family permease [Acidimicrobiales bacterium]|nr:SLC13 family permease [Acidimicrobiales bacterium]